MVYIIILYRLKLGKKQVKFSRTKPGSLDLGLSNFSSIQTLLGILLMIELLRVF